MGLEAGIWASRLGKGGMKKEKKEEKISLTIFFLKSAPGALEIEI